MSRKPSNKRPCGCRYGRSPGFFAQYSGRRERCGCCGLEEDVVRILPEAPATCADCLHRGCPEPEDRQHAARGRYPSSDLDFLEGD